MHAAPVPSPVWPQGVTLLLGIGAQKAGTSWLHAYLRGHPDCAPTVMKELHYFDSVAGRTGNGNRLRAQAIEHAERTGKAPARLRRLRRLQAISAAPDANDQSYIDLVTEGAAPGQVALDVTPEYAILPEAVFARMAALAGAKMVFILREPVARLWSAVRMAVVNRDLKGDDFDAACGALCDEFLSGATNPAIRRSDYAATLLKLETLVPAERRLVLFFEDLFRQSTGDRICDFLGIARHPVDRADVRNEGQKATMRPEQVKRATERLRPQYEAVCALYGADVPAAWHARFAPERVAA